MLACSPEPKAWPASSRIGSRPGGGGPVTWLPWIQKRPIGWAGKLSAVRASQSVDATGTTVRSIRPMPAPLRERRQARGQLRPIGRRPMQQLDLPQRALGIALERADRERALLERVEEQRHRGLRHQEPALPERRLRRAAGGHRLRPARRSCR